jgi:hypothetical protein
VPSYSVIGCAASYVNLVVVVDGAEDAFGLETHSCKGSGSSGLMLFGRHLVLKT